ncbi:hypothetical protein PPGU19_063560 (plasmid) [Paraburkholderia sp. PGU19]|nr:hypothetical protein PPGU19_063560 [Paraburkholderia sp. PGU19]
MHFVVAAGSNGLSLSAGWEGLLQSVSPVTAERFSAGVEGQLRSASPVFEERLLGAPDAPGQQLGALLSF